MQLKDKHRRVQRETIFNSRENDFKEDADGGRMESRWWECGACSGDALGHSRMKYNDGPQRGFAPGRMQPPLGRNLSVRVAPYSSAWGFILPETQILAGWLGFRRRCHSELY